MATSSDDPLPDDAFPGRALYRPTQMTFDSPAGVTTTGARYISRVEHGTVGDSTAARVPCVAFVKLIEEHFQIYAMIATSRVFLPVQERLFKCIECIVT